MSKDLAKVDDHIVTSLAVSNEQLATMQAEETERIDVAEGRKVVKILKKGKFGLPNGQEVDEIFCSFVRIGQTRTLWPHNEEGKPKTVKGTAPLCFSKDAKHPSPELNDMGLDKKGLDCGSCLYSKWPKNMGADEIDEVAEGVGGEWEAKKPACSLGGLAIIIPIKALDGNEELPAEAIPRSAQSGACALQLPYTSIMKKALPAALLNRPFVRFSDDGPKTKIPLEWTLFRLYLEEEDINGYTVSVCHAEVVRDGKNPGFVTLVQEEAELLSEMNKAALREFEDSIVFAGDDNEPGFGDDNEDTPF